METKMLRMKDGKKFTPFQESLLILATLSNQIKWALKAVVPEGRAKDEDLKFTVCNYIQVLLCSFLEEWKNLKALGSDEKIRAMLKIVSPALDRIQQWRGLYKVRSTLLAHGHRDKRGAPAWPWEVFGKHDAPTAYAETILLGNCAVLATRVLLTRHQSDYQEAVQQLNKLKRGIEDKGIRTVGEIVAELNKIKAEMSRIAEFHVHGERF